MATRRFRRGKFSGSFGTIVQSAFYPVFLVTIPGSGLFRQLLYSPGLIEIFNFTPSNTGII